jgi:hypothetical protein
MPLALPYVDVADAVTRHAAQPHRTTCTDLPAGYRLALRSNARSLTAALFAPASHATTARILRADFSGTLTGTGMVAVLHAAARRAPALPGLPDVDHLPERVAAAMTLGDLPKRTPGTPGAVVPYGPASV